jgi:hypothetical protein
MTLDELLLQKLAEWRPDRNQQTLEVDHPATGWKVALTAEVADTVGCRLREIVLTRLSPLHSDKSLSAQAEEIAHRVRGLLEPLSLIEVDSEQNRAQLRSQPPAHRGDAVQYYEVLRQGDGLTRLNRYESQASARRQPILFNLTHEAIALVASALATV